MPSAPTLAIRLLTWLAVLGLVVAGVWSERAMEARGAHETRLKVVTGLGSKFVAIHLEAGATAAQPRQQKAWSWATRAPESAGVRVRSTFRLIRSVVSRHRPVFRGPGLVGVIELRL